MSCRGRVRRTLLMRCGFCARRSRWTRSRLRMSRCRRMRRALLMRCGLSARSSGWTRSRLRMSRSGRMGSRLFASRSRFTGLRRGTCFLGLSGLILGLRWCSLCRRSSCGCCCLVFCRLVLGWLAVVRPRSGSFIRGRIIFRLIFVRARRSCFALSWFILRRLIHGCLVLGRRRLIRSSSLLGRYGTLAGKLCRFRSCGDCRASLVHRRQERVIGACRLHMLSLDRGRLRVLRVGVCLLRRSRTRTDSTGAAVIAHMVHGGGVDYGLAVDIVNYGDVHVIHRGVVAEVSVIPISAAVAGAAVAVAVVHAAVEADLCAPIAAIPGVSIAAPTPIARSPEQACFRRLHPCTRNPEVAFIAVGPVAGRPQVAVGGDHGLLIHRQRRWSDRDRYAELRKRSGRDGHDQKRQQQKTRDTHFELPCRIILRLPVSTLPLRAAWSEGR